MNADNPFEPAFKAEPEKTTLAQFLSTMSGKSMNKFNASVVTSSEGIMIFSICPTGDAGATLQFKVVDNKLETI